MTGSYEFGKVAVFCGGNSHERDISLQSGMAVAEGLRHAGVDVQMIDTAAHDFDFTSFDHVFIALHGRDGEDGKIQAVLEFYGIPYTGSRVTSSALTMNKWYTKAIWQSVGVKTPAYQVVRSMSDVDVESIAYPVYVKPVNEGSSIGITHVLEHAAVESAIKLAMKYDDFVLIEQAIEGKEYTFSFISGAPDLPIICLESATDFYDYEAKYLRDDTQYIVDPPLDELLKKQCIAKSIAAFKSVGMSGWGRVDFIIDKNNEAWFIEVNSVPGMTSHSLVPMAAMAAGLDFSETCLAILKGAASG